MFAVIKLKKILVVVLLFILFFGGFSVVYSGICNKANASSLLDFTIVVDAGHGGRDGGSVGVNTNIKESDINLSISKKLSSYLKSFGFNVVMTRHDENGLYDVFSRDYKQEDMAKRKKIILENKANMVVSIHTNSYPVKTYRGAQVFYDDWSDTGKKLAQSIQEELINNIEHARKELLTGDFYILKCTQNPSIMVESGFLSNAEDEVLLSDDAYQEKLAYAIFCGIVKYFQVETQ